MSIIEKYGHGGDLLTAQRVFRSEGNNLVDFSANINPLGPPDRVMDAIKAQLYQIIHYPDPVQRKFKQKLAEKLDVTPFHLVIGNGAAECMALAILALKPKRVGVIYPCFSEYEQLSVAFGATVKGCYGKNDRQLKPDLAELFEVISEVDLMFIGHPNNPTGMVYTVDELHQIMKQAEKSDTFVVIDEAFIDFLPDQNQLTLLQDIETYKHMIIIRSMTKFYAIPGLRLGYAIAHPTLIKRLKEKQVTWSVNQVALLAGELCVDEMDYAEKTRSLIIDQREVVKSKIEKDLGWYVFSGRANYLLIRLPKPLTASKLQWKMGQKGFLIRSCSMYKGLTEQDFRIAIRSENENNLLLKAFSEVVEKGW